MDTRTYTDENGDNWTLDDTLALRAECNATMIEHAVTVDGELNTGRNADVWEAAHAEHARAARIARAITATPRGTFSPTDDERAAATRTGQIAAATLALRTGHAASLAARANVGHAATEKPRTATRPVGYTVNATRRTWAAAGRTMDDTRGHVRQARWLVRAMLDTVNRERVAAMRAAEMMRGDTGRTRTHAAWERAMMSGNVVGHVRTLPTVDGAWDEWTPRGITNARETRAAERGRGTVKRGPSAARVTTRDHYGPHGTLRMLRTVGVATHAAAGLGDYPSMLAEMLRTGHPGTYLAWNVRPTDGRIGPWLATPRVVTVTRPTHTPRVTTPATPIGHAVNAAESAAARDHALMAAIGSVYAADDV